MQHKTPKNSRKPRQARSRWLLGACLGAAAGLGLHLIMPLYGLPWLPLIGALIGGLIGSSWRVGSRSPARSARSARSAHGAHGARVRQSSGNMDAIWFLFF